jgi:hypothetical protein
MDPDYDDYDNDEWDWTGAEWDLIRSGQLSRHADEWGVTPDKGERWEVWRGWGDDAHERLYRSPTGQYFLGTAKFTNWGGHPFPADGEYPSSYVPPYDDVKSWAADPLRGAPPCSLQYAETTVWPTLHNYDDPFQFARESPFAFMRVVAAGWFLDRDQGGCEQTFAHCPADLQEIAAQLERAMRENCDCETCQRHRACYQYLAGR